MSDELFENFDLEETNKKSLLKNKRKQVDTKINNNKQKNDENASKEISKKENSLNLPLNEKKVKNIASNNVNTISKPETKSSLLNFINPDKLIENRLHGLIDNPELLKGSEEIRKMGQKTFSVTGCNHEVFMPIQYDFKCK